MTTYRRIKAVELTISVLKCLAQKVRPISGQEVAESLGESYNTIMCHLTTLEDGGLVKRVGDSFELGIYFGVFWASIQTSRRSRISEAQADLEKIKIN